VTNNQIVNLALSNGQVVSTTLANLQSLAQPQNMLNTPTSNGKSPASEKKNAMDALLPSSSLLLLHFKQDSRHGITRVISLSPAR